MARELVIYTDESDKSGKYYANFYGGVALWSYHLAEVRSRLEAIKHAHNLFGELKWQKVTGPYLEKYRAFVDEFFDLIAEGKARVRIMFTQNYRAPASLDAYQREHAYHILYYQFIKHAFGLEHASDRGNQLVVRLYLDRLPDTHEKNSRFKGYLHALENSPSFRSALIRLPEDQMAEVASHEHVALQALDVVLGAMQFRLNDKHLEMPPGASRRGKKTIAKEKLYKHINARIRELYPNFNIGVTTSQHGERSNRWHHPYRHWCFTPSDARRDPTKTKPR